MSWNLRCDAGRVASGRKEWQAVAILLDRKLLSGRGERLTKRRGEAFPIPAREDGVWTSLEHGTTPGSDRSREWTIGSRGFVLRVRPGIPRGARWAERQAARSAAYAVRYTSDDPPTCPRAAVGSPDSLVALGRPAAGRQVVGRAAPPIGPAPRQTSGLRRQAALAIVAPWRWPPGACNAARAGSGRTLNRVNMTYVIEAGMRSW